MRRNIVALDCAVDKGSIAVLTDGVVSASTAHSDSQPSRAEEVLVALKKTIAVAGLALHDVDQIAVSIGPGSYSGIRIGMATALGLSKALRTELIGVSVLDALAQDSISDGRVITAVAVGKRHVAWGLYEIRTKSRLQVAPPILVTDDDFVMSLRHLQDPCPIVYSTDLAERFSSSLPAGFEGRTSRVSIADLIGLFAERHPDGSSLIPLYLRDQPVVVRPQA